MVSSRRSARLFAAAVICLVLAPASSARQASPWNLRVGGVFVSPAGDRFVDDRTGAGESATYAVEEDGSGVGIVLSYRLSRRWSVELGALFVELDNEFRLQTGGATLSDTETMGIEMFLAGADLHLTPDSRVDLHLGLFVAETSFEDVTFLTEAGRREKLAFDDDYGFGARLGVDLPLRREGDWFLAADLRYLVTIQEGEVAGQDLDLDPLLVALAVGYRF